MSEIPRGSQSIASRLIKASTIYGISNAFAKAMLFVLLPAFTHFLTAADYGIIALCEMIAIFLSYIAALGLPSALSRKYFEGREDRPETVATIVQAGLVSTIGIVILVELGGPWVFDELLPAFGVSFQPYVALAIGTAVAIQISRFRQLLYQAEERPVPYAVVSILEALIAGALVTVFVVFLEMGALGWLLGRFVASTGIAIVNIVLLRGWIPGPFSGSALKSALAFGLPLVPHQMSAQLLAGADRFFLEYFRDMRTVGIYSLAYGLGTVLSLITMTIIPAWFPQFYKMARSKELSGTLAYLSLQILSVLAVFAIVGIMIGEPFVRFLLHGSYVEASSLVSMIIFATFLHGIYVFLQLGILESGRTMILVALTIGALACNLILNLAFVPGFGAPGAAYATIISHAGYVLGTYYFAQKLCPVDYSISKTILIISIVGALTALSQISITPMARMSWLLGCGLVGIAIIWTVARQAKNPPTAVLGDPTEEE